MLVPPGICEPLIDSVFCWSRGPSHMCSEYNWRSTDQKHDFSSGLFHFAGSFVVRIKV